MQKSFSGKGSTQRPYDKDKFNESFDRIFKNKKKPIRTYCQKCGKDVVIEDINNHKCQ